MVGHDEVENPIKHMDGLKGPRFQYFTSGVSNVQDSNEESSVSTLAPKFNLSIGATMQASWEQ